MWYQVFQPSVQNKVIASIVPLFQFDILFRFRSRAESVKSVVRSFESLRDISKPFRSSRESLKDISRSLKRNRYTQKTWLWSCCFNKWNFNAELRKILFRNGEKRDSCGSLQSMLAVTSFCPHDGASVRSAPGVIERSATIGDVFTFTFDVSLSLSNSPNGGSPGRRDKWFSVFRW